MEFYIEAHGLIPRVNLGGRAGAKIELFSGYGHVAYQIQGNDVYSNMEANMCCHIQEFHKNHLIFSLKLHCTPLAGLNFSRYLANLNSRLAKTGFMQYIGLKA